MDWSWVQSVPTGAFVALGAVAAAAITGIVSFANLVIAKESKVSEFRQQWIDGLRKDVSVFFSQVESLSHMIDRQRDANENRKFTRGEAASTVREVRDAYCDLLTVYRRVLLRLNPIEHGEFEAALTDLYELFHSGERRDPEIIREKIDAATVYSRRLLKAEWVRVKKGERAYRHTKHTVFVGLVLSFILMAMFFLLPG